MTHVFYLYRDHAPRREALGEEPGSLDRYRLFGLDELSAAGLAVSHNLDQRPPWPTRRVGRLVNRALSRAGGYGGDFATVLTNRRRINRSDVVLSTVDTVGLPLVLSRRALRLRPPVVYVSVGLPERLEQLRGDSMRARYRAAFSRVAALVAYSQVELDAVRAWLDPRDERPDSFHFVPFGVDTAAFAPDSTVPVELDVVSVGADPHRDFSQLVLLARGRPELQVLVVTTTSRARELGPLPPNLRVEADIALVEVRRRLLSARVVALPVDLNTYSSATTVLLQAMACGRPVVVSRTPATETGYHLVDGENCVRPAPGDAAAFGRAVGDLLEDEARARDVGDAARATAVHHLGWEHYTARLREIVVSVSSPALR
jgi:glycosyltransferase involved in cell wall biosynthesis